MYRPTVWFLILGIAFLFASLGSFGQDIWSFVFGAPSPLWKWIVNLGISIDDIVRRHGASPFLMFAGLMALGVSYEWASIVDYFRGRTRNKNIFVDGFSSAEQKAARRTIKAFVMREHLKRHRDKQFDDFAAKTPTPVIPQIRRIVSVAENLPLDGNQRKFLDLALALYPAPPKEPSPELDKARATAASFWNDHGIKMMDGKLRYADIEDQLSANEIALRMLVFLELAQILRDRTDTGPGKRGLFFLAKEVERRNEKT